MRIEHLAFELDGNILCKNCFFERLDNISKQEIISILNDEYCLITNEKWKAKGLKKTMWCEECNVAILYNDAK